MPDPLAGEIADLRKEVDLKHNANRKDIHELKNGHQAILLQNEVMRSDVREIRNKVTEVVGNGKPGILDNILTEVRDIGKRVGVIESNQNIRAALEAQDKEKRAETKLLDETTLAITFKKWSIFLAAAVPTGVAVFMVLWDAGKHYLGWK